MRRLFVGDPHVKPSNLDESDRLNQFIIETAIKYKVDRVEFAGDLFDTHEIVRLRVLKFWDRWLNIFAQQPFETVVLVGNHDLSGDYSDTYSSLSVFRHIENERFKIVNEPTNRGLYGYMPYVHDNEQFISEVNKLAEKGAKVVVSHTTYEGSAFDNGLYAPNGVDHARIDSRITHLISGHIHSEQEFGRIHYPGTARWATSTDANMRKGIYLFDHDDTTGSISSKELISTETVCVPIIGIEVRESDGVIPVLPTGADVIVNLIGSSAWIAKTKDEFRGKSGVKITSKTTDVKKSAARKSGRSLMEFVSQHFETKKRERLIQFMQELKIV